MTAAEQLPGPSGRTYSYNLDHTATPGGMNVRWRIRIAAGREAERLDVLQQRAIIDLLNWADKHEKRHRLGHGKHPPPIEKTPE